MIVLAILVTMAAIAWPKITRRLQQIGPQEAAIDIKARLNEARERAILDGEPWVFRIERGTGNYEFGPVSALRAQEEAEVQGVASGGGSLNTVGESTFAVAATTQATPTLGQTASPGTATGIDAATVVNPTERILREQLPPGLVFDDGVAHSTQDPNVVRVAGSPNQFPNSQVNAIGQPLPGQPQVGLPVQPQLGQPIGAVPLVNPAIGGLAQPGLPAVAPVTGWKYVVIFQPDGRATESEIRLKDVVTEAKIRLRVRRLTGGVTIDRVEYKKPIDAQTLVPGQPVGEVPMPLAPNAASTLDHSAPPQTQPAGGLR